MKLIPSTSFTSIPLLCLNDMIRILSKQIPFSSGLKNQLVTAIILGFLMALVMIFLEPFDTYRFESNQRNLILGGFGIVFFVIYLINSRIETYRFRLSREKWTVKHEIVSFVLLIVISSIPIHFYNQIFLNDLLIRDFVAEGYIQHFVWFFSNSLLPIMVMLLPFFVYVRKKLGKVIIPKSLSEIELFGVNKGEKITLQKSQLLFVKSSENYIEIFYNRNKGVQHETYRNTLRAIKKQAPFLKHCHRSYLVNVSNIKRITGNSQNAKIEFHFEDLEIPLSATYYKKLKSSLSI